MSIDRMYCPSTDEVIFAPGYEEINENAEAFIAYWHGEVLDQPEIKDEKLLAAWEKYYEKWDELMEEFDPFEIVEKFLEGYNNDEWIVYECTFYGMACGPVQTTVYYVVKKDTVIEVDSDYNEEEDAADLFEEDEITDQEIDDFLRSFDEENKGASESLKQDD